MSEIQVVRAWEKLTDPTSDAEHVRIAATILRERRPSLVELVMDARAVERVLGLDPARITLIAGLIPPHEYALTETWGPPLVEALRATWALGAGHVAARSIAHADRGRSIAGLISRVHAEGHLATDDLLRLFGPDDRPSSGRLLWEWCLATAPVPAAIVDLVDQLRDDGYDASLLDLLAAWVSPSPERMIDLAAWEVSLQSCSRTKLRDAFERWEGGASMMEVDESLVAALREPGRTASREALRYAVTRHPLAARRALAEAHRRAESGAVRTVLSIWMGAPWVGSTGAS